MKLNEQLAKIADKKGLCGKWHKKIINAKSKDELVGIAIEGIDFCIDKDFPPHDIIRKEFSEIINKHGIFLDEGIFRENAIKIIAFGDCWGNVAYNGYSVGEVYIAGKTELNISAFGNSFVMISLYGNGKLDVVANDNSKVCIMQYGGIVNSIKEVSDSCKVKIVNKIKYV